MKTKNNGLIKIISILFFIMLILCVIPFSFAADLDNADLISDSVDDIGISQDLTIDNSQENNIANSESSNILSEDDSSSENLGEGSANIRTNVSDASYNDLKSAIESSDEEFTIYLGEGTYSNLQSAGYTLADGEFNTNLTFSRKNISFVGAGQDKTFIDGTNTDWLFNFSSSKISFKGISFINANSFCSGYGDTYSPVIYSTYSNLTLENCTIANSQVSGSTYYSASPLFFEGSSWNRYELNITDCLFTNNSAYRGGAMYIASAYANIENTDFTFNKASGDGGAVRLNTNNHNLTFNNCNFINNSAADGGSIYSYYGGNFSLFNCNFINSTAENTAGAVYSKDYNTQYTQVYIYLSDNTFENCTAGGVESTIVTEGDSQGSGPNVIDLSDNAVIEANNTQIIFGEDKYLHIKITDKDGTDISEMVEIIFNNTINQYYIYEPFENGTYDVPLKDYAIGVYNVTINLVSEFYTASPKKVTVKIRGDYDFSVIFNPDHVNLHEGESYIVNGTVVDEYNEPTNQLSGSAYYIIWETYDGGHRTYTGNHIEGSTISFDTSILEMIPTKVYDVEVEPQLSGSYEYYYTVQSGHMYINVTKELPENFTDLDIIYVDAINGNDQTGNGTEENPVKTLLVAFNINDELGGGKTIFVKEGNYEMATYIIKNDVTVIGEDPSKVIVSQPSGTNGMFELAAGLNVVINNMSFTHGFNNPQPGAPVFSNYYASTLVLNNSVFYNNTGGDGGVLYNNDYGTIIIDNCNFHDNNAMDSGVIAASEGYLFIYNSNFTNNKAQRLYGEILRNGSGGALKIWGDTNTVIDNCIFKDNDAPEEEMRDGGGAIAISASGKTTITNSTFINNHAGRDGGAIWAVYGETLIYGCIFINNSAGEGGSVLATEYNEGAIVNLTNCVIITNDASGPVIFVPSESYSTVTVNNNWWGSNYAPSVSNANLTSRIIMTLTNDENNHIIVGLNTLSDGGVFDGYLPVRTVILTPSDKFIASVIEMTENTLVLDYNGNIETDEITATIDKQTLTLNYYHYPETDTSIVTGDITALLDSYIDIVANVSAGDVKVNGGNVSFYINNELIGTSVVSDGIASFQYQVKSLGEFEIRVVFSGYDDYKTSNGVATLNVISQTPTKFIVNSSSIKVGDNYTAQLTDNNDNPIANKNLKVTLVKDGVSTISDYVTDQNGFIIISGLEAGSYAVDLLFNTDDSYLPAHLESTIDVYKYATSIEIEQVNSTGLIYFKLTDENNNTLASESITVSVLDGSGGLAGIDLVTDANGMANTTLTKGNYYILAKYAGDNTYEAHNSSLVVTVADSTPEPTNVVDGKIIQELIDNANPGDVIVLEDYNYVNVSDINITKNITIVGSPNTNISSANDGKALFNVIPVSQGGPESVNIANLTIKVENNDVIVNAIAVNSTNPLGILVAEINIKDNTITSLNDDLVPESVTVLKLESERGVLAPNNEISVSGNTLEAGMVPFKFDVTSAYNNNDVLIPIGGNLPEKLATVIEYEDMTTTAIDSSIEPGTGEYFKITLKDSDGKTLANKAVQFGFNGKIYNKTTNDQGVAELQINLQRADIYTFAVSFQGDDAYNGSFAVAKITVKKQTPSLTVPNKSYKASAKTKTLTATFKSASGKLVANKKVTFTVNGKTYTGTTDSKGVASVNVSLSTKKTYSFTAKFAGDNTYAAITKTAKLTIS